MPEWMSKCTFRSKVLIAWQESTTWTSCIGRPGSLQQQSELMSRSLSKLTIGTVPRVWKMSNLSAAVFSFSTFYTSNVIERVNSSRSVSCYFIFFICSKQYKTYEKEQESPAIADKPARRESLPKIATIRRAYNVVADDTGLSSFV